MCVCMCTGLNEGEMMPVRGESISVTKRVWLIVARIVGVVSRSSEETR